MFHDFNRSITASAIDRKPLWRFRPDFKEIIAATPEKSSAIIL